VVGLSDSGSRGRCLGRGRSCVPGIALRFAQRQPSAENRAPPWSGRPPDRISGGSVTRRVGLPGGGPGSAMGGVCNKEKLPLASGTDAVAMQVGRVVSSQTAVAGCGRDKLLNQWGSLVTGVAKYGASETSERTELAPELVATADQVSTTAAICAAELQTNVSGLRERLTLLGNEADTFRPPGMSCRRQPRPPVAARRSPPERRPFLRTPRPGRTPSGRARCSH
jgi:hypothetical protein